MQTVNITGLERKIYIISFVLALGTYFIGFNFLHGNCEIICFDEKTLTLVSFVMFFLFSYIGLFLLRKNRTVLEIHNGVFDKDIKFYLYNGNKKVDFDRIRAYDDPSKSEVKERLKSFLQKNSNFIKESNNISLFGFSGKSETYVQNLLLNIAKS